MAVLAVIALIFTVASLSRSDEATDGSAARSSGGAGYDLRRHQEGDPLAMGDLDAPVVMVEYADFRCPFCAVFARETMPKLMKYVDDGTLRFEWHDLPVFGPESLEAAVAGRAAAAQGKFWKFHDLTYADAPTRGHPSLPREKLIDLATEAGVGDIEKFTADLDDPALLQQVKADAQKAMDIGATGTPAFFVNGEPIIGAQPLSVFTEAIERKATE